MSNNSNLAAHPKTIRALLALSKKSGSSVLISGQPGSNHKEVAAWFIAQLVKFHDIDEYSIIKLSQSGSSIGIDEVRHLIASIRHKPARSTGLGRLVLITNVQSMTIEAQTLLLKTLEEPPSDVLFVLSSGQKDNLLPTIMSRVEEVALAPLSLEQLKQLHPGYDAKDLHLAWQLSEGQVEHFRSIIGGDVPEGFQLAKQILAGTKLDRLLLVNRLSKDKELTKDTLAALCSLTNMLAAKADSSASFLHVNNINTCGQQALLDIEANVNLKLTLTRLFCAF